MARGSSRGSAIMGPLCVCALCFFTATFVGPLGANAPRGCRTRRQVATETETAFETETEPVEVEDFYELLGVSEEADVKEIKAAYRQAARLTHPDFFRTKPKEEREKAQERFTQVNKAFEVLTDPKKRQAYDLRGLAGLAEFEFNGERIIMPPPWRVRVGYTGHHFWKMKEYFVGFMLETLPDVSHEVILSAFEEATKDPIGVGQAILVDRCTEKRAKDVVEALQEYGLVCMCEEVPDEELREEEDEEEAEEPKPKPVVKQEPTEEANEEDDKADHSGMWLVRDPLRLRRTGPAGCPDTTRQGESDEESDGMLLVDLPVAKVVAQACSGDARAARKKQCDFGSEVANLLARGYKVESAKEEAPKEEEADDKPEEATDKPEKANDKPEALWGTAVQMLLREGTQNYVFDVDAYEGYQPLVPQQKKVVVVQARPADSTMLDLITLVSAVGLQQELKNAKQGETIIKEESMDPRHHLDRRGSVGWVAGRMLDLLTLLSAAGLQQELEKAKEKTGEVIKEETVESDFLGSCAEQMAEAMEGFERLVAQGFSGSSQEEMVPPKKV
ncbi:unnamed protein product [Durusdinium trenchii]|uniref:J domain-containing protein n=1 Tax=Durusdinium trenchii TaxID=1381693 RepID=A0ABP0JG67_9DINO